MVGQERDFLILLLDICNSSRLIDILRRKKVFVLFEDNYFLQGCLLTPGAAYGPHSDKSKDPEHTDENTDTTA